MTRIILLTTAVSLLSACAANRDLTIRPIATTLAAGAHSADFRVAEANGQLRLGNVALALEGFRRALREDPASTAALVGMAGCYDLMGRRDLARLNYEKALALQPRDQAILAAFATSLGKAGAAGQAAQLRREQAALSTGKPQVGQSLAESVMALDRAGASVLSAEGKPVWAPAASPPERMMASRSGARLERTGVGEMMLVTSKAAHWTPLPILAATRAGARPLAAAPTPLRITILNAGSAEGAAARTRTRLRQLGWSTIAIANAARALDQSELLYPAALAEEGRRLARQLPVPVQVRQTETLDRIVLRLGRDVPASKRI
ncbi:LytR C-terminal domain-containing protein [Sphingomonas sp. LHG3443-2]|uniref:LytR C-terminal domain-containing protein n=1 Tax=Sphingomonas sp. LHG3443-2 TaxID=2804639 RepID=UPI003CF0F192